MLQYSNGLCLAIIGSGGFAATMDGGVIRIFNGTRPANPNLKIPAGNVEIDTDYQWCRCFGSGAWGANGLRRQVATTRTAGVKMVVDVYVPIGAVAAGGTNIVGWSDGSAHSQAAFAHGVNFSGSNTINIYEGGVNRGTVGSGSTEGSIYRVRITLGASSATYEIQGGSQYPAIGSASWTNITPGTSSNSTSTLYGAAAAWNGNGYISDMRIY